jgi:hypothetical protein
VLKGRYFPNYDFWSASCRRSASYTWRSILHGRDLVKRGALWRIGNGLSINIMKNYWIPGTIPCALRSLTPVHYELKVASLFAADGYSWDVDRVRSWFAEDVALQILQLPISRHRDEDFLSWPHTRHGGYSVRSAYNLARHEAVYVERSR